MNGLKYLALLFIFMLLIPGCIAHDKKKDCECKKGISVTKAATAGLAGVGLLTAVTYGILGIGFGPLGIAAGSIASGLMSTAATAGAGGAVVATLQGAGAAGMAASTKAAIVAGGAAVANKILDDDCDC